MPFYNREYVIGNPDSSDIKTIPRAYLPALERRQQHEDAGETLYCPLQSGGCGQTISIVVPHQLQPGRRHRLTPHIRHIEKNNATVRCTATEEARQIFDKGIKLIGGLQSLGASVTGQRLHTSHFSFKIHTPEGATYKAKITWHAVKESPQVGEVYFHIDDSYSSHQSLLLKEGEDGGATQIYVHPDLSHHPHYGKMVDEMKENYRYVASGDLTTAGFPISEYELSDTAPQLLVHREWEKPTGAALQAMNKILGREAQRTLHILNKRMQVVAEKEADARFRRRKHEERKEYLQKISHRLNNFEHAISSGALEGFTALPRIKPHHALAQAIPYAHPSWGKYVFVLVPPAIAYDEEALADASVFYVERGYEPQFVFVHHTVVQTQLVLKAREQGRPVHLWEVQDGSLGCFNMVPGDSAGAAIWGELAAGLRANHFVALDESPRFVDGVRLPRFPSIYFEYLVMIEGVCQRLVAGLPEDRVVLDDEDVSSWGAAEVLSAVSMVGVSRKLVIGFSLYPLSAEVARRVQECFLVPAKKHVVWVFSVVDGGLPVVASNALRVQGYSGDFWVGDAYRVGDWVRDVLFPKLT